MLAEGLYRHQVHTFSGLCGYHCGNSANAYIDRACLSTCSTAGDVHVRDSFPEDMFTLKDGATKFRVDKLSAGSDETFQYTLMPKSSGSSDLGHAKVTYLPSTDGSPEKQVGHAQPPTLLDQCRLYVLQKMVHKAMHDN